MISSYLLCCTQYCLSQLLSPVQTCHGHSKIVLLKRSYLGVLFPYYPLTQDNALQLEVLGEVLLLLLALLLSLVVAVAVAEL